MNIALAIVQFLVNEILSVPAFLIGIITAVGLAAMRKSVGQIAGAAIKATLGFLLIEAGAGLVVNSLGPLGKMIEGALGAQGVVPTNEAIAGIAQQQFGSQVAWIMLAGFLISLVLARITPLHYVFLTGHHMLFMATLITIVMASTSMPTSIVIGLGSLLLGVLMVSLPALAHPFTRKITGGEDIAIGHFGTSAYIAAAATGRLVDPHGKSQSTENIKVPEGLRFLRDSMVATALSMVLMYVVVAIIFLAHRGEKAAFQTFSKPATGTGNYIMASVTQGLEFGIAVAVILFGVRTILGELIPAFQGIASKVVPGAIPALDCPIVFPYAQNAVLIGFISSFIGGLVGLTILATLLGPAWGARSDPARACTPLLYWWGCRGLRKCNWRTTRRGRGSVRQWSTRDLPTSFPPQSSWAIQFSQYNLWRCRFRVVRDTHRIRGQNRHLLRIHHSRPHRCHHPW